jgi:hypothetical protein
MLDDVARQTPTTGVPQDRQTTWFWRVKVESGHHHADHRAGVLLLGHGALADCIVLHLQDSLRLRLVGWLDNDRPLHQASSNGHSDNELDPDMAGQTWLVDAAQRQGAKVIVVAMRDRLTDLPLDQLLGCRLNGIEVLDGTAFFERTGHKIPLAQLQPDYLVFNDGFHWPPRLAKRALDLLLASFGLLLTLPLFMLLPLIIKATSSGPVFYRQERAGLNGRRFTILKFRSMYDKAEQVGCPVWAQEQDPRITPIGRLMRR